MKHLLLLLVLAGCGLAATPEPESLTLRLTRAFDAAWDRGDREALYSMMDPEIIYKTPFRTEIGRDAVRDHVFRNAGGKFRDDVSTEEFSRIDGDLAYSVGVCTFNEYDANGVVKAKWVSKYLHIFTRRPGEDWKMRFHVAHEQLPPKK